MAAEHSDTLDKVAADAKVISGLEDNIADLEVTISKLEAEKAYQIERKKHFAELFRMAVMLMKRGWKSGCYNKSDGFPPNF